MFGTPVLDGQRHIQLQPGFTFLSANGLSLSAQETCSSNPVAGIGIITVVYMPCPVSYTIFGNGEMVGLHYYF